MRSVQPLLGPRRPASRSSMTSPLYAAAHPHPAGFREITITELLPHATTHRLVDVREPEEFVGVLGHLKGAELVPLGTLPEVSTTWPKDVPLVMICRVGGRSAQAASYLVKQGFTQVMNLDG